ncbi:MAG: hypothetical protein N2485_08615, partial [bacterium]|nr:hypothetical protein [bacterium]
VIYKEENGNKILSDVEEINSLNRENIARDFLINEWFCLTIDNGKRVYKKSNNIFKNFEIERDINDLVKILAYDIDYTIPFVYAKCYLNIKDKRVSQITE